ncbi:hypothetical protein AB205_0187960 [Aquarana catesbeiana]|uniref:Uncharacterized protein n=1 Tax=Aquarana catesbeiana TaxID=8400 RepID=A0A2G9SHH9_AQUCT|nr:hypothetical protein AB205_0187960 [Aquarana catesbeiana]
MIHHSSFLFDIDQSCFHYFSMMSSRHPYPFLPPFTNFTHLRALSPDPCPHCFPKRKTNDSPLQFIYGTFQSCCHLLQMILSHHPLPPSFHHSPMFCTTVRQHLTLSRSSTWGEDH